MSKVYNKYITDLGNLAISEIFKDFTALFFPPYCMACEDILVKGEDTICTACLLDMPKTDYHLNVENEFYKKLYGRIPVKYVMALFKFSKNSRVQQLMHALKYKNHPEIAIKLGKIYGLELGDYKKEFDVIIPVPLHISRQRKRGYNQSAEFGKGLSEVLEIPCLEKVLERVVKTTTQTRKTKLHRWENVNEGFSVNNSVEISGKRILLVDDVITTGATVEACATVLLNNSSKEISIACLAAAQ